MNEGISEYNRDPLGIVWRDRIWSMGWEKKTQNDHKSCGSGKSGTCRGFSLETGRMVAPAGKRTTSRSTAWLGQRVQGQLWTHHGAVTIVSQRGKG